MKEKSVEKIESITIVPARSLSPLDRAKHNVSEKDFIELRVIRSSPKRLVIKKIDAGVKPTEEFRKAIETSGLLDESFS